MLKAIETLYRGYRFRSRLEARWAVFFDALAMKWEYEREGFETDAGRYLPDFWLPDHNHWIEIKGALDTAPPLSAETVKALDKARMLSEDNEVIMLVGDCYVGGYDGHVFFKKKYIGEGPVFIKCKQCETIGIAFHVMLSEKAYYKAPCDHRDPDWNDYLFSAYEAARAARFEFSR
jgi:hypothetical protein